MILSEAIELSKKGHPIAQRHIYDAFKVKWYMICMRYMKNKEDADDALQNGMVNIFSKMHLFNSELGDFGAWSARIMVNDCIMLLRKRQKDFNISDLDSAIHLQEVEETPYDKFGTKEILHLVSKLPDGYRTIFNLYAVEGYTHREIAETLGISEGTSKSQLFKARKILQEALEVLI